MKKKQENRHNKITTITSRQGIFHFPIGEFFEYKDLIFLFAGRDISVKYRQTILGPLWLIIMPILSALVSTFVFGGIAKIDSAGMPYFLFYFVAFVAWSYFSTCVHTTATTFTSNAQLFRKVYFPRLILPVSKVLSNLFRFVVQFVLLIIIMLGFAFIGECDIMPKWEFIWLIPLLVIEMALLSLGCGIILSSITAKYRDLSSLINVGVDLWKYVTPVVYSISAVPEGMRLLCLINPMGPIIEAFRCILLGTGGTIEPWFLLLSAGETLFILFIGLIIFHRVERTFVDTV